MSSSQLMEDTLDEFFNQEVSTMLTPHNISRKVEVVYTDTMESTSSFICTKEDIIKIMKVLIQKAQVTGGKTAVFKIRQFEKDIKILNAFTKLHISTTEEIKEHFVKKGKKNPKKIEFIVDEYLKTGRYEEYEIAIKDPLILAVGHLMNIYGVGQVKAKTLYTDYGITDISTLRSAFKKDTSILNSKQIMGLTHYDDLNERIPRQEIDAYYQELQMICKTIPNIKMSITGSYRREHTTSGDVDVLVSSINGADSANLRKELIRILKEEDIIVETLASGKKKFMGITKLESKGFMKARHMDIINTSPEEYPFALLYFTGSGEFNSRMRAHALTLGYSMNEYCLSDRLTRKPISVKLISSKISRDVFLEEKDIFTFLGMEYVEPKNRK
jgi:DNA polymerase/3'-5' exonuclease PolX